MILGGSRPIITLDPKDQDPKDHLEYSISKKCENKCNGICFREIGSGNFVKKKYI